MTDDSDATPSPGPAHDDGLEKQPVPAESNCPYCGGDATDESTVTHRLSANGYLHDDQELACSECDETWMCGVPIGDFDGGRDLLCASCNAHRMLVHRVGMEPAEDAEGGRALLFKLHLKCPNCYHFDTTTRVSDERNIALVGYPAITGDVEMATSDYGYQPGETPGKTAADLDSVATPPDCEEPSCLWHGTGVGACPNAPGGGA